MAWGLIVSLASLLAAAVLIYGNLKQAEYERAAKQSATEYKNHTYTPKLRACLGIATTNKADCIYDARNAQRENERSEYDLEAQRITALWTAIMGGAAVAGMLLSAIGVGLVWVTFAETREANRITVAAQRAWVTISVEIIYARSFNEFFQFKYRVRFENIGDTVAHHFWADQRMFFTGGDYAVLVEPWQAAKRAKDKFADRVLLPGEVYILEDKRNYIIENVAWLGKQKTRHIAIAASAFYNVTGDNIRRHTERTFLLLTEDGTGRVQEAIHRSRLSERGPIKLHIRENAPRHAN